MSESQYFSVALPKVGLQIQRAMGGTWTFVRIHLAKYWQRKEQETNTDAYFYILVSLTLWNFNINRK